MSDCEFGLRFSLSSCEVEVDDVVERLGAAGCDDATVGIGRKGRLALDFIRKAESPERAVLSAIADVRRAIPDAALLEASPDLVGLTDIAEVFGVTRQNTRKLILECDALAPAPVHEGKPALWHLAGVLEWLRDQKGYAVADDLMALARATMQVNLAIREKDVDQAAQREILALL